MTFAAVGSAITSTSASFSINPAATGHLILVEVICEATTVTATSMSGGHCTWSVLTGPFTGSVSGDTGTIFVGTATATGAATATVSFSGATPTVRIQGQEFSSTVGSWSLDVAGHIDFASGSHSAFASLTPAGSGELYFGFAFNQGTASSGSTSGYTYNVDGNGNGMCYNAACTSSAQAPTWSDTTEYFGVMALVKESASNVNVTPTTAAVKVAATEPVPALLVSPVTAAVKVAAFVPGFAIGPTVAAAVVKVTAYPPSPVFAGGASAVTAAVKVTAYVPTPTLPSTLLGLPQINDWPVNYTPTYADLNLYVRDAFKFLTAPPVLRVQQTSTQSLGSLDQLHFQSVIEDTYSGWDSGNNWYTAQLPGWYAITSRMNAVVTAGTGISFGPAYVLNGTSYGPTWLDLAEAGSANWTWVFYEETYLDTGDTVSIYTGGAAAGGGSPVTALTNPPTLEIVWLSE